MLLRGTRAWALVCGFLTLCLSGCGGVSGEKPPKSVQLSISLTGSASGVVTSNPAGINCGQTCTASFNSGTSVTLTATPSAGDTFAGWSGVCSGTGICTVTLNTAMTVAASFASPVQATGSLQSLNHIIFMLQENRSFDHYFGQLPTYLKNNGYPQALDAEPANASNPGADGKSTISAFHLLTQCVQNLSPFWNESHRDYNLNSPLSATPAMNGFVVEAAKNAVASGYADRQGRRAIGYYDWTDLPYYYFMAANFATSDRWFSPVMSRTQPNRMYLMAATTAGHVHPLNETNTPPLPNQTIFDALQKAGISWKIYVSDLDRNPPLQDSGLNDFQSASKYPQNFVPASQFHSDLSNGTLPQVVMIEPGYIGGLDEHPTVLANVIGEGVQAGSNYVSTFINDFMASQYWKNSVFILTFDEGGGFYYHVPPVQTVSPDGIPPSDLQPGADFCLGAGGPTCDFTYTGFRVPLIVISPFTKKNYVSHTPADYTAILKLIETRFNIPSLTKRDAQQMDMTEFFDFANVPWKTPPSPPAQPTNSDPCYLDHLP